MSPSKSRWGRLVAMAADTFNAWRPTEGRLFSLISAVEWFNRCRGISHSLSHTHGRLHNHLCALRDIFLCVNENNALRTRGEPVSSVLVLSHTSVIHKITLKLEHSHVYVLTCQCLEKSIRKKIIYRKSQNKNINIPFDFLLIKQWIMRPIKLPTDLWFAPREK